MQNTPLALFDCGLSKTKMRFTVYCLLAVIFCSLRENIKVFCAGEISTAGGCATTAKHGSNTFEHGARP